MSPVPRLSIVLVAMLVAGACRVPARPAADTLVFGDEFSGTAIDRAKWTVYTGPVYNSELQAYVDDTATMHVADGMLVIHARERAHRDTSGRTAAFVSGRLHGRTMFTHGTVAARMKLPAGAGLWPAFWLLGEGAWPAHGEIDVMENVGDSSWVNAALHGPGYSGNTPLVRRDTFPAGQDATAWHVYAVTWTADSVVFRVDDVPYYRVTRAEIERYGAPAALDSAKYVVLNLAVGGEYPAAVNNVRAPRLGLPDATAQRIRAGDARVYVDWVRVTRAP